MLFILQLTSKDYYRNSLQGVFGVTDEALTTVLKYDGLVDWSKPTLFGGQFLYNCYTVEPLGKDHSKSIRLD